MIFLTGLLALILTRVTAIAIDYALITRPFSFRQFFNITDLNFNYLVLAFVPMLAYQFFSFNFQLNRRWSDNTLAPIWLGMAAVVPVAGLQIFRGVMLGWPSNFLVVHGLEVAVCVIVSIFAYIIWRKGLLLRIGFLSYVLYAVGIALSYLYTGALSQEELRLNTYALAVFAMLVFIPYIPYNLKKRKAEGYVQD